MYIEFLANVQAKYLNQERGKDDDANQHIA